MNQGSFRGANIKKYWQGKMKPCCPGEIVIDINEEFLQFLSDNSAILKVMRDGVLANAIKSSSISQNLIDRLGK